MAASLTVLTILLIGTPHAPASFSAPALAAAPIRFNIPHKPADAEKGFAAAIVSNLSQIQTQRIMLALKTRDESVPLEHCSVSSPPENGSFLSELLQWKQPSGQPRCCPASRGMPSWAPH